ncbi:MAG: tRNA pseudouridine(38-40) synthase TruA [Malacoplasma sp.]
MNYTLEISYIGTNFFGFSKQLEQYKTVQSTIEGTLLKFFNKPTPIIGCGRTDKYVHAIKHISNFHTNETFNMDELFYFLQKNLSDDDIYIKKVEQVKENFHARFSCKSKTYLYKINDNVFNCFQKDYIYQFNRKINMRKMKRLAKHFIGEKNFLSFSTSKLENTTRTINWIKIKKEENIICIYINANGFLRNMVRMIVASLIKFSFEYDKRDNIFKLLDNPKKGSSIEKAPGLGLYLFEINY